MALIAIKKTTENEKVKLDINKDVYTEVRNYCSWAEIGIDYFFEEAAQYVFSKDKDWKARNRSISRDKIQDTSQT